MGETVKHPEAPLAGVASTDAGHEVHTSWSKNTRVYEKNSLGVIEILGPLRVSNVRH